MINSSVKTRDAADPRGQSSSTRLSTFGRRLRSALGCNGTMRHVRDLSDATLRDIGLSRAYVERPYQPRRLHHI